VIAASEIADRTGIATHDVALVMGSGWVGAVESIDDLAAPTDGLPPTDGIRLWLSGGVRIIIRPSGTEAKLKCYIEVIAPDKSTAENEVSALRAPLKAFLGA
jgi:phosphomannomutase